MKKHKTKKIIAILTAVAVLTFGLIMPGSASSEANSAAMPELPDQSAALAANELLWQTFTLDAAGMPIAYPEEYGGAFIDGELLYIYLVGLNDELEAKYMEICNNSPVVRFLEADYSANYLQSLYDVVDEYVGEYEITAYGIDFRNNRFNVELNSEPGAEICGLDAAGDTTDACAAQEDRLERELLNPAITFSPGSFLTTSATNLTGGDALTGYTSAGVAANSFSLGIGGRYNGKSAVLTAGHCVASENGSGAQRIYSVAYNSTIIGTVGEYDFQYSDGESGDWAVITITNSNYAPTNDIYLYTSSNSIDITSTNSTYVTGQFVNMYGCISGYRTGVLKSYGYTFTDTKNDVTLVNMCKVDAGDSANLPVPGDSGGPVYASTSTGYSLLGTITGYNTTTIEYIAVFSPIGYALNAGFSPLLS